MKKLIAVAVLAAFSSLPYAAEKDITTDVVVVGQGAAGTAAAFAAAEQGAKVIGLEKKGMVGGTGNFSEGRLQDAARLLHSSDQRRSLQEDHELWSLAQQCPPGSCLRRQICRYSRMDAEARR
mgnify:CR=1 FL=1